jgi:CRISPR-associated exonuclease Cas4
MSEELDITGTNIWYYHICKREAWLMMHQLAPDQEDENVEIGRFIHEYRYGRAKKEIAVGTIRIDQLQLSRGRLVIKEVKKSSKFIESARLQLLYYLYYFKKMGIEVEGELRFPEERRTEKVQLSDEDEEEITQLIIEIKKLYRQSIPPAAQKINFCRNCAYKEFCWAEG